MSFLPKDDKEPVVSNYMKFQDGENPFRVLGSAVVGWEYWTETTDDSGARKSVPTRVKDEEDIPEEGVATNKFGNPSVSYFWAFPVYNIRDDKIQILVVKQKTVRDDMRTYINNKKWGDPKTYNFVVSRGKNGDKTEYHTIAEPKEELDADILKKYQGMSINMQAWMAGKDPFSKENTEHVDPSEVHV